MILRKQDMMESMTEAFYAYSQVNEDHVRVVQDGVTMHEAYLLIHLHSLRQPRTPKQLQEYFLLTASGMSNLLRRVELKGWIVKTIHPTLANSKWIVLTESGQALADRLYQAVANATAPMLTIFSLKETNYLLQLVKTYIRFIRGHLLEFQEANWGTTDVFVYYYYQLYFGIDWAMQTKNVVPISFKESRILQAINSLTTETHVPTLQAVAQQARIGVPECSEMTTRLVQRGVVDKILDPDDHRLVRLATSEATKAHTKAYLQYQGQWVDDRVMKPKLQELISFFLTMRKFTKYYQKSPETLK